MNLLRMLVPVLVLGGSGLASAKPVTEIDRTHQMCTSYNSDTPLSRVVVSIPLDTVTVRKDRDIVIVFHQQDVRVVMGDVDITEDMKSELLNTAIGLTKACIHAQREAPAVPATPDADDDDDDADEHV